MSELFGRKGGKAEGQNANKLLVKFKTASLRLCVKPKEERGEW
jgi:hypothetical protein